MKQCLGAPESSTWQSFWSCPRCWQCQHRLPRRRTKAQRLIRSPWNGTTHAPGALFIAAPPSAHGSGQLSKGPSRCCVEPRDRLGPCQHRDLLQICRNRLKTSPSDNNSSLSHKLLAPQLSCQRMASKAVAPPWSQGSNWLFRHLQAPRQGFSGFLSSPRMRPPTIMDRHEPEL